MTAKNQRDHVRAAFAVEITLDSDSNFYAGVTYDVSEGGLFIATYAPPDVGSWVSLDLALPGMSGGTFRLTGVVRWIRSWDACSEGMQPGCGIQFNEVPAEALLAIRGFVQDRDPVLYEAA